MWWVSRKEFDEAVTNGTNARIALSNMVDNLTKHVCRLDDKISKLEATLNCRDGKHEWINFYEIALTATGTNLGKSKQGLECKHCTIKKDEWEEQQKPYVSGRVYGEPSKETITDYGSCPICKQPFSSTINRLAHIDKCKPKGMDFKVSSIKPQPKRKKGKTK